MLLPKRLSSSLRKIQDRFIRTISTVADFLGRGNNNANLFVNLQATFIFLVNGGLPNFVKIRENLMQNGYSYDLGMKRG